MSRYNPDEECKAIVERLKKICKLKGVKPYMLAKDAKLSTSTVSYLFNGRTKPQVYTLLELCNVLDIAITDLFENDLLDAGKKASAEAGGEAEHPALTENERKMLQYYRYMPQEKREFMQTSLEMLYQYQSRNSMEQDGAPETFETDELNF